MRILTLTALVVGLAACTGTTPGSGGSGSNVPDVKATSYPVWYLATRIAAPRLKPELVLAEGEDPETWQPSGEQVAALADADLILVNGAGYESWLKTATLPAGKVVDTSSGLSLLEIDGPTHSHGVAGEHSHTGTDPRFFVDPERYRAQAKLVHAALVQADPGGQRIYDAQLGAVERNVDDLVAELDPILASAKTRSFRAAHPSFTYLADRGGLQIPLVDPAAPPTEDVAPGTILLWDRLPTAEERKAMPAFQHEVLDPLTLPRAGKYDYFSQARLNGYTLKKAIETPIPAADTDAPTVDTDAPPPTETPPPTPPG